MLEKLIESRNEERTKLDALLGKVEEEDRTELSEDENAEFDTRSEKIKALDERIAELEELAERDAKIAESRQILDVKEETVAPVVTEMKEDGVYENPKRSFLTDAYSSRLQSSDRSIIAIIKSHKPFSPWK